MTELLLLTVRDLRCQADRHCDRVPCFQVRIDAVGCHPVRRHAELCAEHLGAAAALAAWAREQGLEGTVTVLAIDQLAPGPAGHRPGPGDGVRCGLAFGTIALNPQAGGIH